MNMTTRSPMPNRARSLSLVFVLAAACTARADNVRTPQQPPATMTPERRARTLVEKQLKALPGNNAALVADFAKDAVVMLPYIGSRVDAPDLELATAIAGMHPHVEMKSAQLTELVAGGNTTMVWLAAELEIVLLSAEPGEAPSTDVRTVRAVELLDAASDWKIVAASFVQVRGLSQRRSSLGPIPSPTSSGPLTPLLVAPDKLAAAVSGNPVVLYGTEKTERAVGASAVKKLLAKWRKLPLELEENDKVREIRTANWGYAMADVNIPKPGGPPYRMSGFLIAVPDANGAWSVVAANYGAL
jgi:hypothetical protein